MRTVDYTDMLQGVASLMGVAVSDLAAEEKTIINTFFRKAIRNAWQTTNWVDTCNYFEYRVPGNVVPYPNTLTAWTLTNATVVVGAGNPIDGEGTASKITDTTANGSHKASIESFADVACVEQVASVFIQRGTHRYFKLGVRDGASVEASATFDLVGKTYSSSLTANLVEFGSDWYCLRLYFTPTATGRATFAIETSLDGSNFTYIGDGKFYTLYHAAISPNQDFAAGRFVIKYDYPGLDVVDTIYDIYDRPPTGDFVPRPLRYIPVANGFVIPERSGSYNFYDTGTNAATSKPNGGIGVYINYRKEVPGFLGGVYSNTTQYYEGDVVYYEVAGVGNYYECLINVLGTAPTSTVYWKKSLIPESFLDYCVHSVYADWQTAEGQEGKAQAMRSVANELLLGELDKLERQSRNTTPIRISTHISTRQ